MDLYDSQRLLHENVEDFLMGLYRQCKITDAAQINFLAGRLGIGACAAHEIAEELQRMGLIRFGPYGSVCFTKAGKEYAAVLAKDKEICYTVHR